MPYPDIKDPKWAEELVFVHFLPEILLVVTAPVWVSVLLIWGLEDIWFSLLMAVLITIAAGCFVAAFVPRSAWEKLRTRLGFRSRKKVSR